MPITPAEGGGSGGASGTDPLPAAQIPDLYNPNKTIRFVQDFVSVSAASITPPFSAGVVSAASVALLATDGNRICVWDLYSSTTAGSSVYCGIQAASLPHASKPTLTVYFKTPSVINANTVIQIGTHSASSADRTGLEISGATCQGKVVVGGVATSAGGTYTLAPDTWYIGRVIYSGDSSATFELYSDSGVKLYTHTASTALFAGNNIGIRATNSGVVSVQMCRLDMMELVASVANRFYLSV